METTPFEIRSSLNAKECLALLGKTPAEPTTQEGQAGGNSLFAGMLGQKISEVALSASTPAASSASRTGKRTLTAVLKGKAASGKHESPADGNFKSVADHDPRLSNCNHGPLSGLTDEIAPLAGPTQEIATSLTEKRETAEEAEKTGIQAAKEVMELAIPLPVTGESIPHADPPPTEKSVSRIVAPHLPDPAPFTRTGQLPEAKALEGDTGTSPAEKVARKELAVSAPKVSLPLSDLHADHFTLPEENESGTEDEFMKQATETPQRRNGTPSTDAAPDLRRSIPSPQDPTKRAGESKEPGSVAAGSQKPVSEDGSPGLRPPAPSTPDPGKRTGRSREGEPLIAVPEKPVPAVQNRESAPELSKAASSPGQTLPAADAVAEATGPARDRLHRNTTASHAVRHPERDIFPFSMEMSNIAAPKGTGAPDAGGSTGIEMQAVIDQLVEARKAAGSDSGRIRILLTPPNLGTIDLDIIVRGERVEVVMTAENPTVQQALQSRGDDIRIALQRQDLKIEGFQVLLQDNAASRQQTDSGAMYRQDRENRQGFNTREDVAPTLPLPSPIAGAASVAGRVSIFA